MTATPPRWAEALLALVLERDDVDSVTGDLLEEYRDSVHPIRGKRRADWWYVTQVAGFVWLGHFEPGSKYQTHTYTY